ncbi:FCD domain-containing protein [Paraburkholderia metrosideri]|nr:FCD domain-containing protein [Paraburkholderia metrosideri]
MPCSNANSSPPVSTHGVASGDRPRDPRKRLQPYRRLPFQRAGGMKRSFDGHDRIVQAILAGDSRAAAEEMRSHVTGGLTFLDFIAEMPDDFEV